MLTGWGPWLWIDLVRMGFPVYLAMAAGGYLVFKEGR